MSRFVLLTAASALALSGCGGGDNEGANAANDMLPGRTENGQLTVRAQGVDLKINLPPPIRRMTEDDDFLYPRARAQRSGGEDRHFHSDDAPERVAGWYQDRARASRFSINAVSRDGGAIVLAGTARGGDRLNVRLAPGAGGGTDGILRVTPAG